MIGDHTYKHRITITQTFNECLKIIQASGCLIEKELAGDIHSIERRNPGLIEMTTIEGKPNVHRYHRRRQYRRRLYRALVRAGIHAIISNSRGPEALAGLAAELRPFVTAATVEEAAKADIVLVAVPGRSCRKRFPACRTGTVASSSTPTIRSRRRSSSPLP